MVWRGIVVAAAVFVTSTAGAGGVPSAVSAAVPVEALLVGDSVMNGMAQSYGAPARASLASRHSYILDTAGCRRLITTSCSIGSGPRPSNALSVVSGRAGQYDGTLVIAVGYNDPPSGTAGLADAVDVIIEAARSSGIHDVVWLTYREAGSAGNVARFRANNDVLRAKVAEHAELRIADWAAASAGLPSSWFSADGIHLGASAASAMADLIAAALDEGPGRRSARCASDVFVGDQVLPTSAALSESVPGRLHLLEGPLRLLDTRSGPGMVGAGRVVAVPITGAPGVGTGATAAVVSVVSVDPCTDGYLTAFPCGAAMPVASMLNAGRGITVANTALVAVGDDGAICIYSSEATDVIVDLTGFVGPDGLGTTPLPPQRLVDTRAGAHQVLGVPQARVGPAGLTVDVTMLFGSGPVPSALSVNLTAVSPSADGFLSLLPGACTGIVPNTSTLNVRKGRDVAATSMVRLTEGRFCVFSSTDTDVVVDLQAEHGTDGAAVTAISPTRLHDSRATQRLAAGSERRLSSAVPAGISAAALNVTVVDPARAGYVSLYPCGQRPEISNLNVGRGGATANVAIVPADENGDLCVFTSTDTDFVIDVEAWVS